MCGSKEIERTIRKTASCHSCIKLTAHRFEFLRQNKNGTYT